jgi:molybdopterin-containing oxidoreductase family membrane subunit
VEVLLADPVSELAADLAEPEEPLVWDVFAILTYLTVSATFFYVGLVPDIAVLRDQETNPVRKRIFAALSLGWRNSDREWRHFTRAYLFLAAFATPLVLSVHSVVSFDFAMALTPGWHATIFPPYFVAGAIFSGIGMVFTIIIPLRKFFKLQHFVTINDLDAAAKLCLFTSMVVGLAYLTEFQVAWMSGNKVEQEYFWNRVFGQWAWSAWIMLICNMVLPLSLFSQKLRRNTTWLFILSIFINIGMWFERFVIVVPVALARVRAVAVGQLRAHVGGLQHPARLVRLVLHVVPALHQAAARHGARRDQGDRPAEDARARGPGRSAITTSTR